MLIPLALVIAKNAPFFSARPKFWLSLGCIAALATLAWLAVAANHPQHGVSSNLTSLQKWTLRPLAKLSVSTDVPAIQLTVAFVLGWLISRGNRTNGSTA